MNKSYAETQVCQMSLTRGEIEKIVLESLLTRGGDPSYDFSRDHPIFLWDERGDLRVRFVQEAVVNKEPDRWFGLKPVPTRKELDKILSEREVAKT